MSEHWYKRDGSQGYEVLGKNGKLRPFNLRWDRDLGYVPSVTTITDIINKPALVTWKVNQGIMSALTLPRGAEELEKDWLVRVSSDAGAQAREAAEEGTRIHDAIEARIKGKPYPKVYEKHVAGTLECLKGMYPHVTDWVSEASFAHKSGYGGKVDLHSPSTGIIVDFKGKDLSEQDVLDKKKLAYDQNIQLGAYNQGLGFEPTECGNIFVSRTVAGLVVGHNWAVADIQYGIEVFNATLGLWKAIKKYDGSF